MTRNEKMLAAATKRIEKHQAQVQRLDGVIAKAIEKCNNAGDDVTPADFRECAKQICANYHDFECTRPVQGGEVYRLRCKVITALEDRYHHLYEIACDKRQIEVIKAEMAAEAAAIKDREAIASSSLAEALRKSLEQFRSEWMNKMEAYHIRTWKYVDLNKAGARYWCMRYNQVKAAYPAQISHDSRTNSHQKLANRLYAKYCRMNDICNHPAGRDTMTGYLKDRMNEAAADFEGCIVELTGKCRKFGVDESRIETLGIDVTPKGFEAVIRDGKARRIYARMIWAAEDSVFMVPHVRYIVTEKTE